MSFIRPRFMRQALIPLLCLVAAACGQSGAPSGAPAGEGAASAAAASFSCDSPAVPLAIGASVTGDIPAAANYPANARYFCVNVGAGVSSLTLELSGMQTDLDLYVGSGSISSVQGVNLEAGDTYQWKSNEFGNGDERVVIQNPQPGIYYAEIVSYQGQPSSFNFTAR